MANWKINIAWVVKWIKNNSPYFPILEWIVNSIHAIEEKKNIDWLILVSIKRKWFKTQSLDNEQDDWIADIDSVEISDNWIWFNEKNLDSFETYLSDYKSSIWWKWYWRFLYLKFFKEVKIKSIYEKLWNKYEITFDFSIDSKDMIKNKKEIQVDSISETWTTLFLNAFKPHYLVKLNSKSKTLETFSRKLLEHLLIYFISWDNLCPKIIIKDWSENLELNSLIWNWKEIEKVYDDDFKLNNIISFPKLKNIEETFRVKIFKIRYWELSDLNLCANNRVVTEEWLSKYIPDFIRKIKDEWEKERNYTIKVYITSTYLDKHVDTERDKFDFITEDSDSVYQLKNSDTEIKQKTILIIKKHFSEYLSELNIRKKESVKEYIKKRAPRYSTLYKSFDFDEIEIWISDENLDKKFHELKYKKEKETKEKVLRFSKSSNFENKDEIRDLVNWLDEVVKTDLAHYVATRKFTLYILEKALEFDIESHKYISEDSIHSIIFPTKKDSEQISYSDHNLWIIDEKLTYTDYLISDKPLNWWKSERPDILIFDKKIAVRWDNDKSNPITIFEFKKPWREDFILPSSKEDPIEQIVRYVNSIRDWEYKTPEWREINVEENTPFYWYVVCTLTKKVKEWLYKQKEFKMLPDWEWYFRHLDNNNLYIEILSWDKILKDSQMRNKIFFEKLKI